MAKLAIVVLADNQTHGDTGYLVNALELAVQAKAAGDEVKVIFDGAGTKWVPYLTNTGADLHPLYKDVEDVVAGACKFCADAYGVQDRILEREVDLLDQARGHPPLRELMGQGFEIVTF